MNKNGPYSDDAYREIIESDNIDKHYEYYWLWFKKIIINFNNAFLIEELCIYSSKLNLLQSKIISQTNIIEQIEQTIKQYLYQCTFTFIRTKNNIYYNKLLNTQIKRFNMICQSQDNHIKLNPFLESSENSFYVFFYIIIHLDKHHSNLYAEIFEIALNKITIDIYSNELLLCSIYDILFREKSYGIIDSLSLSYSFCMYLQNRDITITNKISGEIINIFDLPEKITIIKILQKYIIIFNPKS
jgi:hypothetical protein